MVRDLALEDRRDIFADSPVAAVGLDQDPFKQVVGQVDRVALDLLRGAAGRRWAFLDALPPALAPAAPLNSLALPSS
jgi:hypothetical protein